MDPRQLTPDLAVSPQIAPADVAAIAAAGFKVLINNRPDDEVSQAEANDAVARAAQDAGLEYHYLPFSPSTGVTPDLLAGFDAAIGGRKPVFAYCRSGNRCTVLWGLTQAGRRPSTEIAQIARDAGYDLSGIMPMIEGLASRR